MSNYEADSPELEATDTIDTLTRDACSIGFYGPKSSYRKRLQALITTHTTEALERVREAVGEDDLDTRGNTQNPANPIYWTKRASIRNELRAEIRKAIDAELTNGVTT